MVAFSKILKQAYEFTRQNRFLWILGLFLSLSLTYFVAESSTAGKFNTSGYLLPMAIWLVFFLFAVRSNTALIIAIKAVHDKEQTSVVRSLKASKLFYGRTLAISIQIYLAAVLLTFLVLSPARFLYEQNQLAQSRSLLTLGIVILTPILMAAVILSILAFLFVIYYDLKNKEAFQRSWELLGKHWQPLFGLLIFLLILDAPALFLAQFMVGLRGGSLLSIVAGIIFLLYQTVFLVGQQVAWILLFNDLIKPQKLEADHPSVAPEIA